MLELPHVEDATQQLQQRLRYQSEHQMEVSMCMTTCCYGADETSKCMLTCKPGACASACCFFAMLLLMRHQSKHQMEHMYDDMLACMVSYG